MTPLATDQKEAGKPAIQVPSAITLNSRKGNKVCALKRRGANVREVHPSRSPEIQPHRAGALKKEGLTIQSCLTFRPGLSI